MTIRLSRDVVTQFRATGEGWQTRIDAALRQFISEHPLSR
ncbi:BrnA antitoxin family protein [Mycetohabitans rhizoxinica]